MTTSDARLPAQLDPLIAEAKQRARRRRLALAGAFLLVAIAVAAIALNAAPGRSSPAPGLRTPPAVLRALASTGCSSGPRPAIGKFPGDKSGDGKITDSGNERIPALVAAVGDHGIAGYVKATDVFCQPSPVSPAAALASMGKPQQIPVYAANGTTRVDTFTIGPRG